MRTRGNDRDRTRDVVDRIGNSNPRVRCHPSHYERGFGFAVRAGLDEFTGDAVAILMTQRLWTSPSPPGVYLDFWTSAYQAIDD